MWELYDALIDGIPAGAKADELIRGTYGALVVSGGGCGYSPLMVGDTRPETMPRKSPGMPLKDLAGCIRSWNYIEASVGLAAVNAWYNGPEAAAQNGVALNASPYSEDRLHDPFIAYQNAIRNKKVAVVGHFHYLEQLFSPVCELFIIEREPLEGDYPVEAAEDILPQCDIAVIACTTLVFKTLPRLLELAKNAWVVLVGPATPLAPPLLARGVRDLSGFVIRDGARAKNMVAGFERLNLYSAGQKVSLKADGADIGTLGRGGPDKHKGV